MYLNKVMIIGNITRDPELKALPGGSSVCNFSVATNRTWKDKDGQKQESVEFHNIVCFGKTAENVAQYMSKGSQIYVEGRLQTRSWEDKESGKKVYRTEINAEQIQFGNKPKDGSGSSAPKRTTPRKSKEDAAWDGIGEPGVDTIEYPEDDINPDDIPF